jgi:hypothetical protein
MTMMTVAVFETLPDAQIAVGRLEAEGLSAYLADSHLVQTDWLYAIAIGGIKVQVAPDDAEQARAILARDDSDALEGDPLE